MKIHKHFLSTSIAALLGAFPLNAANFYWDGGNVNIAANGNGASGGTAGTWNTSLLNWDTGASPHVAWSDQFTDTAIFGGTVGTVTVGAVQVGTISVNTNSYIFNTGTIAFGTGGIIDVNTTSGAIFNATLSGALRYQATGSTLNLASVGSIINGDNVGLTSFELALNADANNAVINHAGALGPAGTPVKLTKGTLNLGNNAAPNNNQPITYSAWDLEMAGGYLRGRYNTSTITGAVNVTANSGVMARGAAGINVVFTNTINLNANTFILSPDSASAGVTMNGVISGTGNLVSAALFGSTNGRGTWRLGAANTFSGTATTPQDLGTLALVNVDALQNATLDTGAAAGSQQVTFTVGLPSTYNIGALAGSDPLALVENTISVGAKAVNTTFNADISGTGGITKVGAHSLTLTAATSYSGATEVTGGALVLSASGSISGSSGIAINGATAKLNASGITPVTPIVTLTQGTLTGAGTVNTVIVDAGTGGRISNNDGASGASLNIGSLTLTGGAALNLFSSTTAAPLVVGAFTNDSAAAAVTITANNPGGWSNGSTYDIIGYTALGGTGANNFARLINNLSARQSGLWGNSGTALTLAIAGDNPYWTGAADGNWDTSTINWKLVTGGTATSFLTSDDVLFNDNATGSMDINIAGANVAANTTVFNNSLLNYTVGSTGGFGIFSGSFAKSGSGSVTLNTANSYAGGTTLNAGTLNVGHASALGSAASTFTISGGTINNTSGVPLTTNNYPVNVNGDFAFTGTNSLNLGTGAGSLGSAAGTSRTITVNGNALTLGGPLGNGVTANSLVKNGLGTLILKGANNFTGSATLLSGSLRGEGTGEALGAGTIDIASGELQLAGDVALSFGRNTTVTENAQITSDTATSAPGVTHTLGTLAIGANTLTIARGLNAIGSTAGVAFGATTFSGAPTFAIGANATLSIGAVTNDVNDATITGAGNFRQTGVWGSGSGGIVFAPSFTGIASLNSANTFSGAVTIHSGTVIVANSASLGSNASGTTVASGATLDVGGSLLVNTLNLGTEIVTVSGSGVGGSGAIVNNGSFDQTNALGRLVLAGNATFGGARRWDLRSTSPTLDMAGFALTKTGTNQVSLVGATVSNPGNVIINSGIFGVETTSDLGGSDLNSITANAGSTFNLFANTNPIAWTVNVNNASITQGSTNATIAGPVVLTGTNTISIPGASLTLSGIVSGAGGFNKTSAGVLNLTNSNTYAGATIITVGMLRISTPDGLGTAAAGTTVLSGGMLQLTNGITPNAAETLSIAGGGSDFFGSLQAGAGGGTWAGGITLGDASVRIGASSGNTLTLTGTIADGVGTGFNISGQLGMGSVVLNPTTTNTYTGTTGVLRGTLRLGKTNALPTTTVLDVDSVNSVPDAATFDMAGFDQTVAALQDTATVSVNGVILNSAAATTSTLTINGAQNTEFNGIIQDGAGQIALTKAGTGTLRLSGNSTFSGTANVDGGTLLVTGSITGTASINDGGTLSGSGITGEVTATSGAFISPGLSPGILTTGSLTMTAGSTLNIEIEGINLGSEYDQLNVTGTVDIAGATLALSGAYFTSPEITNDLFTILINNGPSPVIGTFAGLAEGARTFSTSGQDFTISYVGGDGNDIVLTAVPEPGSAVLVLGGFAMLGARRRRKA